MDLNKLKEYFPELYMENEYFECRDGWFSILYNLSIKILESCKRNNHDVPHVDQVKEKFATLRYYLNWETPEISSYIEEAEKESAKTCEICGDAGVARKSGWIKTLCDKCNKEWIR